MVGRACFAPGCRRTFAVQALVTSIALIASHGCSGEILIGAPPSSGSPIDDDDDPSLAPVNGPAFLCSEDASIPEAPLRRLSRRQIQATIADLVQYAVGSTEDAAEIVRSLESVTRTIPNDATPTLAHAPSFRRADLAVTDHLVESTYHLATAVGRALADRSRLARTVGECATDDRSENDEVCLRSFIERFGSRALRARLTDEDVDFYARFAREAGGPVGSDNVANVVAGMLLSPRFFYHVESGIEDVPSGARHVALSATELAARLSYQFWDSIPDERLWGLRSTGRSSTRRCTSESSTELSRTRGRGRRCGSSSRNGSSSTVSPSSIASRTTLATEPSRVITCRAPNCTST